MRTLLFVATLAFGMVLLPGAQVSFAQDDGGDGPDTVDPDRDVDPGANPTDRRAQTTMKFLTISLDARAAAMGSALTAEDHAGATAMFYNPAGMARLGEGDGFASVSLGQVQWLADFTYNHLSAAFSPAGGRYGVIGFSVRSGDYGDFIGTVRDGSAEGGFRETGTFSPSTFAAGVSYAKTLGERFSVGTNVKYAMQDLGGTLLSADATEASSNDLGTVVVDFGMLYESGFRGINLAAAVRNFSQEVQYADKYVELPLELQIGLTWDVMQAVDLDPDQHAFTLFANAARPRDFDTNAKMGGEYVLMNTLALRAGYEYPNGDQGVNLGAGLQFELSGIDLAADYAYTSYATFSGVNRISLQLGF